MAKGKRYEMDYDKIDSYIEKKGISNSDVSINLGYTRGYYAAMRSNKAKFTKENAAKLVKALNVHEKWDFFIIRTPNTEAAIEEVETEARTYIDEIHQRIIDDVMFTIQGEVMNIADKHNLSFKELVALLVNMDLEETNSEEADFE